MLFALGGFFMADLPGDTSGAVLAVTLGVGARAAFLAKPLVVLLADGKNLPIRVADAIHALKIILYGEDFSFCSRLRIFSSSSSMANSWWGRMEWAGRASSLSLSSAFKTSISLSRSSFRLSWGSGLIWRLLPVSDNLG
jgi:hypothetical protein